MSILDTNPTDEFILASKGDRGVPPGGNGGGGGGGLGGFGSNAFPMMRRLRTGGFAHPQGPTAMGGQAFGHAPLGQAQMAATMASPMPAQQPPMGAFGASPYSEPDAGGTGAAFQKPGASPLGAPSGASAGTASPTPSGPNYSSHPADPWQDPGFAKMYAPLKAMGLSGPALAQAYNAYLHSPQGVQAYSPGGAQGGFNQWTPGSQPGYDEESIARMLIGQYGNFGSYGPNGSQGLYDALQHNALQQGNALQQNAYNTAVQQGNDPAARAYAALQGSLNSQQGVANLMGQANLSQLQNQQQFGQNLLAGQLGYINQRNLGQQGYDFSNALQQSQQPSFGQQLGGIAGGLLGSALPTSWFGGGSPTGQSIVNGVGGNAAFGTGGAGSDWWGQPR